MQHADQSLSPCAGRKGNVSRLVSRHESARQYPGKTLHMDVRFLCLEQAVQGVLTSENLWDTFTTSFPLIDATST